MLEFKNTQQLTSSHSQGGHAKPMRVYLCSKSDPHILSQMLKIKLTKPGYVLGWSPA